MRILAILISALVLGLQSCSDSSASKKDLIDRRIQSLPLSSNGELSREIDAIARDVSKLDLAQWKAIADLATDHPRSWDKDLDTGIIDSPLSTLRKVPDDTRVYILRSMILIKSLGQRDDSGALVDRGNLTREWKQAGESFLRNMCANSPVGFLRFYALTTGSSWEEEDLDWLRIRIDFLADEAFGSREGQIYLDAYMWLTKMVDPSIQPKSEGDINSPEGRKKIQMAWKKWWEESHNRLTLNPVTGQYQFTR